MNTFLDWFVQATIATAILIPVVSGLSWLFRNRPSVRHALWVVVLLKFATPPIVSLPVVVPEWIMPTIIPSSLPQVSELESELVVNESRIESSLLKSHHDIRNNTADAAESMSPESRFEFGENRIELVALSIGGLWLVRLAMLAWMTGILVLAIKHFRSLRQQVRLLSRSASASPELQTLMTNVAKKLGSRPLPIRVVPGIVTPFVWCLGRLKIIWPEGMAGAESIRSKQMIIAHELSHVRRRDHWIAWIELVAGLIWWWNPLFWFVCKNIRVNSEMACDALALEQFPEDRGIYAETLFALSVSRTGEPPLVLAVGDGTPSILERRISMMMHDHISGKFSLCGLLVAGLLTAGTLPILTLGQESPQDSNRKAPVSSETTTTNVRSIALSRALNILEANPPQLGTRSNELAQHLTLTMYGMSNPSTESRLAEALAKRGKSRAILSTMRPNDETLPQLT
jgi:beta-lactamase regulating signal transducer with metallopeptidase domain